MNGFQLNLLTLCSLLPRWRFNLKQALRYTSVKSKSSYISLFILVYIKLYIKQNLYIY